MWLVDSLSRACLEWLKMGFNGLFPGCMDRLRKDSENPFGKSLVRSKAFGKILSASAGISMKFSIPMKDLNVAGSLTP